MKRSTRIVWMTVATALTAALAAVPWVSGAPVVVLFPQEVTGTASLHDASGAELPLVSFVVEAVPPASNWNAIDVSSFDLPAGPPPHSWTVTLDGGDPANPVNPGRDYFFGVRAYVERSTARTEYISLRTDDPVNVTSGAPPAPVGLDVSGLRTVTADITVANGTISYLYLNSSVLQSGDQLRTFTSRFFPTGSNVSSVVETVLAPGATEVAVWGQIELIDSAGHRSTYSLDGGWPDLSGGDLTLTWSFDATPTSGIDGTVTLANSTSATPYSGTVTLSGSSSSGQFLSGHMPVAMDGTYGVRIPDGTYNQNLNIQFQNPQSQSQSSITQSVVLPSQVLIRDYPNVSISPLYIPLTINGFYSLASVTSAYVNVNRVIPEGAGFSAEGWGHTSRYAGAMMIPSQPGTWRYFGTEVYVQESYPLPMRCSYRQEARNPLIVDHTVVTGAGPATMTPQSLTLVKGAVYLDIAEPPGDPQRLLSNPMATIERSILNPDNSLNGTVRADSSRTLAATDLAAVGLIAEPGEYTLTTRATVDGAQLTFPQSTIVFGEPIPTPSGSSTAVWTPAQDPGLQVSLDFGYSTMGGVSSVVETRMGPPVPEGFSTLCSPNQDDEGACPPIYYDIHTTVPIVGPAEVCIRQAYDAITDYNGDGSTADEIAGVVSSLALYHFRTTAGCDAHLPPQDSGSCWERLDITPLPSGKPFVVDCAADLAACGCASAAACGITPTVTVLQSCGLTSSFSPFVVLKEPPAHFFNTGVGATGQIQSWQVRRTGTYRITAIGAQGGAGTGSPQLSGGCGAKLDGEFALTQGQTLQILVGQKGLSTPNNGGGGGGSFVARAGSPLLIAGGGGGVRHAALVNGRDAAINNNGVSGSTSSNYTSGFVVGGTAGRGGSRASGYGAGGGGWSGAGLADGTNGEGGSAFLAASPQAGRGGRGLKCDGPPYADGGFGGGGAGNGCNGAGGGGGYSGGGGGRIGGGGGSWNIGANPHAQTGQCLPDGHGKVLLEWLRP